MVFDWNTVSLIEVSESVVEEVDTLELGGRVVNALGIQNLGVAEWTVGHPGGGRY